VTERAETEERSRCQAGRTIMEAHEVLMSCRNRNKASTSIRKDEQLLWACWSNKNEKKNGQGSKEGEIPVSLTIPLFLPL